MIYNPSHSELNRQLTQNRLGTLLPCQGHVTHTHVYTVALNFSCFGKYSTFGEFIQCLKLDRAQFKVKGQVFYYVLDIVETYTQWSRSFESHTAEFY